MSIAEKFEVIADAVYEKGLKDGGGGSSDKYYDTFWDAFQRGGSATSYAYAFYASRWKDDIYNPKYPIVATNANSMFNTSYVTDTKVDIDLRQAGGNTAGIFQYSKLETIQKLIVNENTGYSNCFTSCTVLKEINFEGTIGRSISFSASSLTIESLKNIIEHLKDYNENEPTTHYTLTLSANSKAVLTAEGATATWNSEPCTWAELVSFKKWDLM